MADVTKLQPKENFWDLNGYKKTVERTENGRKMCEFLMKMVEERAGIEKSYAEKLSSWYKKWTHAVDKSPEYGTNKEMLKNFVAEGDELSDKHIVIKDSLLNLVNTKIRNWRDENYRKQLCTCKPASTFKNGFQKAQKPWAVHVNKVEKWKKDYFRYCEQANEALTQEANMQKSDQDAYQKTREKCQNATMTMDLMKEKYLKAVEELEELKPAYVTEMNNVFAAAQEFEIKRLEFFKEILLKLQETLQTNRSTEEIYAKCKQHIQNSDPKSDTQWWAASYGTGMSLIGQYFHEFRPEVLETIAQRRLKLNELNLHTVVPSIESPTECVVQAEIVDREKPQCQANAAYSTIKQRDKAISHEVDSDFDIESTTSRNAPAENLSTLEDGGVYSTLNESHIYTNDVQLEDGYGKSPSGTKVKALYDYKGLDGQELSFKKGDVFSKIKGKDDGGWATGRKGGKVGLFPDDYVQPC